MFGLWYVTLALLVVVIVGIVLVVLYYTTSLNCILGTLGWLFAVVGGIAFIVCLALAISIPLDAKAQTIQYEQLYETYQIYAERLTDTDNATLGDFAQNGSYLKEIAEYNTWLAKAKASQQTYGVFSGFYKTDLTKLQYILIN